MPDKISLVLLLVAAGALIGLARSILSRTGSNPKEREKRRRLAVNARGRLADGNITEADECAIFYAYSVGGVEYATSQDLAELRDEIQVRPDQLIGCPVTVKYVMKNPGNSIVVCEKWSGLRPGTKTDSTSRSVPLS